MQIIKYYLTILCLAISGLVVLSSVHSVQLVGIAMPLDDTKKMMAQDDHGSGKSLSDLHNHPDKGKLLKDTNNKHIAADGRSLRLLQHQRKEQPYHEWLLSKLRQLWQTGFTA